MTGLASGGSDSDPAPQAQATMHARSKARRWHWWRYAWRNVAAATPLETAFRNLPGKSSDRRSTRCDTITTKVQLLLPVPGRGVPGRGGMPCCVIKNGLSFASALRSGGVEFLQLPAAGRPAIKRPQCILPTLHSSQATLLSRIPKTRLLLTSKETASNINRSCSRTIHSPALSGDQLSAR